MADAEADIRTLAPCSATNQRLLRVVWLSALALAAAVLLVPVGEGAVGFGPLSGYPASVVQNILWLIRVTMPWPVAGLLLALVLPAAAIRLLALVAIGIGIMLAVSLQGGQPALLLARDLLFAIPGLAMGLWLADRSKGTLDGARRAPAEAAPASGLPGAGLAVPARGITAPDTPALGGSLALLYGRRAAGAALVAAAIALGAVFPRWGPAIAIGLSLYAALLWWRPAAGLVAVPAALALLDLAPWTGRIFFDEFDLLMLVTTGMLLLRARTPGRHSTAPMSRPLIAVFLTCTAVSATIGLIPLGPVDANAFTSYWGSFNALRVGKGMLWGLLLFWMVRRSGVGGAMPGGALAIGMGCGLLGVGLVGLWERWLFADLNDPGSTYRIVSTFSSMHTGGGHIEAYLVAALPFLWLGLFRLRHLALALPVSMLSAYVMVYTAARAGVLAFAVVAAVLLLATLRLGWAAGGRSRTAPVLALVAGAVVIAAGASGGYLWQRFERSAEDWGARVAHWKLALQIADDSWLGQTFGSGLGSFPRKYLWQGPADKQSATFSYAEEAGNIYLRIGAGGTLTVAQRVDVAGGDTYRLSFAARSRAPDAEVSAPLCEKQLLNSRRCDWTQFNVPSDGQWHTLTHEFKPATVGQGPAWRHLPVELYFHNGGTGGAIDIDQVRLLDAGGHNLVGNGDFSHGGDRWFFKAQNHLPWHIKNLWVHAWFEMGWAGGLLLTTLVATAAWRLARAGWNGSRLAWVMLASLSGLLTVGLFDSLLDAPRLSTLLIAWLFLGCALPWSGNADHAAGPRDT